MNSLTPNPLAPILGPQHIQDLPKTRGLHGSFFFLIQTCQASNSLHAPREGREAPGL